MQHIDAQSNVIFSVGQVAGNVERPEGDPLLNATRGGVGLGHHDGGSEQVVAVEGGVRETAGQLDGRTAAASSEVRDEGALFQFPLPFAGAGDELLHEAGLMNAAAVPFHPLPNLKVVAVQRQTPAGAEGLTHLL